MAKKKTSKAITKVGNVDHLPAHLQSFDAAEGMEEVKKKVIVPRMKLIQGQSSKELRDRFGEGTCIFQPGDVVVADQEGHFRAVPIFYFVEYVCWSDTQDKASPSILERSFDPTSPVAVKAQNPDTRTEEYMEGKKKFTARNAEVLNFVCFMHGDSPLAGEPFILSFQRGEYINGQNFCSFLKLRKAPIWANIIEFHPAFRERNDNEWWGYDFGNPEDGESFISAEETEFFRAAHLEFKDLYEKRMLVVDHGEADDDTDPDDDAEY